MKIFISIKRSAMLLATSALFFTACNKLELEPTPAEPAAPVTGTTIAAMLDDPSFSLLKAAVVRVGLASTLADTSLRFTVFAPDDSAIMKSLGVPSIAVAAGYLASLPDASVAGLVSYHIIPQSVKTSSIPQAFPNFGYPTILNPSIGTPDYNPFVRLSNYPSKRGSIVWVNNIPVIAPDIAAANGTVHKIARVLFPPSRYLCNKIDTDTSLSFLKAAILRADSGTVIDPAVLNTNILQSVLSKFGPDLTVFAPTNAAFRTVLYAQSYPLIYQQIYNITYQAAIGAGAPPALAATIATDTATVKAPPTTTALTSTPAFFQNPLFYGALPAQSVKGIVVYHVLGKRAFGVNFPATATSFPTLLNGVVASHPGVSITATFTGPSVTGLTVKGVRNAAANVLINPLPDPLGTSDQNFANGNLHKIDQVLLPQ